MGWSSGSELAQQLIEAIQGEVEDKASRRRIYKRMITALESFDWDTQEEALGIDPEFDKAWESLNN